MASRKKKKRRKKKVEMAVRGVQRSGVGSKTRAKRPSPVQAIEGRHAELATRLAQRPDRFSQLLAKAFKDERAGQQLISRSGLTAEERQEILALTNQAHVDFRSELSTATHDLRDLLRDADPLYSVAVFQATNLMSPWGGYYEPTQRGGENAVELVASLIASQPPVANAKPLPDAVVQQVFDQIAHILDLLYLVNFTNRRSEDHEVEALRFTGAMHWMGIRGTSFGDHGKELAKAVFEPFDHWMLETYGFTLADVIALADAVEATWTESVNDLLRGAAEFADGVFEYLGSEQALPAEVRDKRMSQSPWIFGGGPLLSDYACATIAASLVVV